MTTTKIAGIEIDDVAIIAAETVADELDKLVPQIIVWLDAATAAMTMIEVAAIRQTECNRTDEQGDALRSQTAYQRLEDHFYALNERTEDTRMHGPEYQAEIERFIP